MREIDYTVMGHAFATHSNLGRLCDESVYQHELFARLHEAGIQAALKVPITLAHRQFFIRLELDLVVSEKVIYELKTAAKINSAHLAQLLGYLFATNSTRGKLINFRPQSIEARFVNTTLDDAGRRRFLLSRDQFFGADRLAVLIHELIEDWGTGLDASLYRRAILGCYSADIVNDQMLPMSSDDRPIGNQRFHLLDHETALSVTTFADPNSRNLEDFRKLLAHSPLSQLHWLNVSRDHVQLCTIRNDRMI